MSQYFFIFTVSPPAALFNSFQRFNFFGLSFTIGANFLWSHYVMYHDHVVKIHHYNKHTRMNDDTL
jgi:hypothetical protein